jgi:hypothetical protein
LKHFLSNKEWDKVSTLLILSECNVWIFCQSTKARKINTGDMNKKRRRSHILFFSHLLINLVIYFIFYYVHTLFGLFLHSAPLPHPSPLPSSVSGRSRSAPVTDFVKEKT